jgi:hypothetical protein
MAEIFGRECEHVIVEGGDIWKHSSNISLANIWASMSMIQSEDAHDSIARSKI